MKAALARFAVLFTTTTFLSFGGTVLTLTCIPSSEAGACVPGLSSQILIDIADAGGTNVDLTFTNNGPVVSAISDIYFHTITSDQFSWMENHAEGIGVNFSDPTTDTAGSNLPRGNSLVPQFETSWHLHNEPGIEDAIDVGETLTVRAPGSFNEL